MMSVTKRPVNYGSTLEGCALLALQVAFSFLALSDVMLGAQARPPIDANPAWGSGAHLLFEQPALLYKQGAPTLSVDALSDLEGRDIALSAALSARLSERLSFAIGTWRASRLSTTDLSLTPLKLLNHGLDEAQGLAFGAQLTLTQRLSFGVSLTRDVLSSSLARDVTWRADVGLSYEPSAWLRLGVMLNGVGSSWPTDITPSTSTLQTSTPQTSTPQTSTPQTSTQTLTPTSLERPRALKLTLGLQPVERFSLGAELSPERGGGSLDVSARLRLWRGLTLESSASREVREGAPLAWAGALAWTGSWGWRLEGAQDTKGATLSTVSLRLSDAHSTHTLESNATLALVTLRGAEELSVKTSLLGAPKVSAPFLSALRALDALSRRAEVRVVMLVLNAPAIGWAQAEELSAQLKRLKSAQKRVIVFLPKLNNPLMVAVADADELWMSPTSEVTVSALLREKFYLKGLLERFKVKAEFISVGDYKSAPEMFTHSGPSQEAREAEEALLQARYQRLLRAFELRAQRSSADHAKLKQQALTWLQEGPYSAHEALERGLIDHIVHAVDLDRALVKRYPKLEMNLGAPPELHERWGARPQLAALYVVGELGGGGLTGGDSVSAARLAPMIRQLSADERVKGVLLRIDSPGGAISDADELWRALSELAQRKPLVASMGDVAASGGYYVAAPAQVIFASPNTVTGSIGVFAGKVDLSPALEWLGVGVTRLRAGPPGGGEESLFTPWSDAQRARLKRSMTSMYELFLSRVLEGRSGLTRERLLPLAGGRVWTGQRAREQGLVDVEGGALDALRYLTYKAGLSEGEYELKLIAPAPPSLLDRASALVHTQGAERGLIELLTSDQRAREPHLNALFATLPTSLSAFIHLLLKYRSETLAYLPPFE